MTEQQDLLNRINKRLEGALHQLQIAERLAKKFAAVAKADDAADVVNGVDKALDVVGDIQADIECVIMDNDEALQNMK